MDTQSLPGTLVDVSWTDMVPAPTLFNLLVQAVGTWVSPWPCLCFLPPRPFSDTQTFSIL